MKSALRQVACRGCETLNSLDSKFCKNCGQELHADDRQSALEQNRLFVQEGFKALNESRVQEAILIAKNAIEHDSTCVEGYSLLGESRERDHDFPSALSAYEKCVELEPTSSVHKLKIEHLKNLIAADTLYVRQAPTKRLATVAGLSAFALVACVGSAIALSLRDPLADKPQTGMGQQDLVSKAPEQPTDKPSLEQKPTPEQAKPEEQKQPEQAQEQPQPQPEPERAARQPKLPPARPANNDGGDATGFTPVRPNVIPEGASAQLPDPRNTTANPTRPKIDEDPEPVNTTTTPPVKPNPTGTAAVKPDKPRTSIVQITPSKGSTNNGGGTSTPAGGGGVEALTRSAQQAFISGHYEEAISLYQRALGAGAPTGRTHQRIAMAYERLGRKADAISAYQRAISAYEGSDSGSAKDAADACRRAVEALRG